MQVFQPILAVAVVAGALTSVNSAAEARHYREVEAYAAYACGPVPPSPTFIYPEANWEPFFRRHVYRYGPVLACVASATTTNVISVRY
jgi:hypothetical protein